MIQKNPFWTPSGSGYANSNVYREEINPTILAELWSDISSGDFKQAHVGMHYTASSGRKYWFADADYFFGSGDTEMTAHHMVVIEDEIQGTYQQQTTDTTAGGAKSSLIYTTYLPAHQSELEDDFGVSHIKEVRILLSNTVSSGCPSAWSYESKKSFILNMPMVYGHHLQAEGKQMFNGGNRARQCSLFQHMPETIIARLTNQTRQVWWTDDVASSPAYGAIYEDGGCANRGASYPAGVRRAFLIG